MTVKALARDPFNIVICGVGGQGNVLASELLASAVVDRGWFATVGETYGASQRGGSVMSHVRVSAARQLGPLIPKGEADILVGIEPIETLRLARQYGNSETCVVFNPRPNYPLGVLIGEATYPGVDAIERELAAICGEVRRVEATELARHAGSTLATNIVLLGALAALPGSPVAVEECERVLEQRFQGRTLAVNREALRLGHEAIADRRAVIDLLQDT